MNADKRSDVYAAIDAERDRQDEQWGTEHDRTHSIPEWTVILRDRLDRVDAAWMEGAHENR